MAIETTYEAVPSPNSALSPKRHLSPEQITQIVAQYQDGATARELGERLEVHRTTVSGVLKANGVVMRRHPMQPSEIEQAITLYESGLSLVQVAEQLPYDPSTIWRELKQLNVQMRDCQGKCPLTRSQVLGASSGN